jgi:hypothetical protein
MRHSSATNKPAKGPLDAFAMQIEQSFSSQGQTCEVQWAMGWCVASTNERCAFLTGEQISDHLRRQLPCKILSIANSCPHALTLIFPFARKWNAECDWPTPFNLGKSLGHIQFHTFSPRTSLTKYSHQAGLIGC